MEKLAYTTTEAGELSGLSKWTIYRLVEAGHLAKLPHTGRRVLIAKAELERFVSQGVGSAS